MTRKTSGIRRLVVALLIVALSCVATSASAQTRLIIRDSLGLSGINLTCLLLGCKVQYGLGDPNGQLFLVTFPSLVNPLTASLRLTLQTGIVDVEIDQKASTLGATASVAPNYLTDNAPVSYYGTTVWHGYVAQPANQLVRSDSAHSNFGATGAGVIVAVIDTGVDPNHPVLKPFLTAGYDFTRNTAGGSETSDVNASPNTANAQPGQVNQSTVALVDQSTVALVDGQGYQAFGHGTMTAGVVHLVAPQAQIMPLKAFGPDGSGYASDVLRAIYYAVKNGADVLSMSFSFAAYSPELKNAINYATQHGAVSVASSGNDGQQVATYPGALPGVIDVASTNNYDVQSSFTNFGAPPIDIAAPGEAIMTTYPWGTYAAGWGTSFSAPFVAGTTALALGQNGGCNPGNAAGAINHAVWISNPSLNNLRVDAYQAVQACH